MPSSIFVSYSHKDAGLVKPVVGLLRGTKDLVYQDLDSIKPGGKWRLQIEDAIRAAHLIVLFWCYHSSQSIEVRAEYKLALVTGKDVLPVLLDTTPLPAELSEFQWVDFRQVVSLRYRSYRRWIAQGAVLMVLMLTMSFLYHFFLFTPTPLKNPIPLPPSEPYQMPLPTPEPPQELPPPLAPLHKLPVVTLVIFVIFLATVGALAVWMAKRAGRRRAGAPPTNYQQLMAEKLREELFRRGIGLE